MRIDITNQQFNKLKAIKFVKYDKATYWLFKCECGLEKIINKATVVSGKIKTCGCFKKCSVKNKFYRTYVSWFSMRGRCLNDKRKDFKYYGGKGIKICNRWDKFENFLEDMGERPNGKSLDRIDNNKGYNKENCKWADEKEQKSNMSSNILVKHNNKTITMAEWSRITNINYETIKYYRRKKFSFEQIKDKFNLQFL